MQIDLRRVEEKDKTVLANLLELYQYDFSEFAGFELDQTGRYGYKYLDKYFQDQDRHPFFIFVDEKLAGFVLINRHTLVSKNAHAVAEFFVLKKYRDKGMGKTVAQKVFKQFPGEWEVAQTNENIAAQKFWEKVVNELTGGSFERIVLNDKRWKGPVLRFSVS